MDEIRKDIYRGKKNNILMAYKQTKGRGRRNNRWTSSLGNLFISIKLNTYNKSKVYILNYITAIVVYDTISHYLNENDNIIIKWPNDILINNRKIAGILIESVSKGKKIIDFNLGIGINLKFAPENIKYKTTSLMNEGVNKISRKIILTKIISLFNYWERVLKDNNSKFIIDCWMKRSIPLNSEIRVRENNKIFTGIYKGIDLDGSIKVMSNNKIGKFHSLEIIE